MFERASVVELAQLAQVLEPRRELGPYVLTGRLARSETALLYTASGGAFGTDEGVLKLTSGHHASRLRSELERLVRCADAGVAGVVRPLARQLNWLPVPDVVDAHVAVVALPFLTGGDLNAVHRVRSLPAVDVAFAVAGTLRHLLELPEPMAHGNLSPRSVLLPYPEAAPSELTLIDFGSAGDLSGCTSEEIAALCRADVVAFGALLQDVVPGELTAFSSACRQGRYASMADARLWRDLQRQRAGRTWLGGLLWRR